jgi:hypothetical protein
MEYELPDSIDHDAANDCNQAALSGLPLIKESAQNRYKEYRNLKASDDIPRIADTGPPKIGAANDENAQYEIMSLVP